MRSNKAVPVAREMVTTRVDPSTAVVVTAILREMAGSPAPATLRLDTESCVAVVSSEDLDVLKASDRLMCRVPAQ